MQDKLTVVYNPEQDFSVKSKVAFERFIGKVQTAKCKQFVNLMFYVNDVRWNGANLLVKRYEEPEEGCGHLYFLLASHEKCYIFGRSDISFMASTLPYFPTFNDLTELKERLNHSGRMLRPYEVE